MKKMPLSQGKFALVDDEYYDDLNQFKWYAWATKRTWYAIRNLPKVNGIRKSEKMHRRIMGIKNPKVHLDHRDRNGLNNQKKNIRFCNSKQNGSNRSKWKTKSTSNFKGVNAKKYYTGTVSWIAQICVARQKIHLGCFKTEKEAAIAYNNAAIKHNGEFAYLNKV